MEVTERRTKTDWARVVRKLVDEDYADRERIILVKDNLNTHRLSSMYEAFEPAEARRIAERLEIHYRFRLLVAYAPDRIPAEYGGRMGQPNFDENHIDPITFIFGDRSLSDPESLMGRQLAVETVLAHLAMLLNDLIENRHDPRVGTEDIFNALIQPPMLDNALGEMHRTAYANVIARIRYFIDLYHSDIPPSD